MKIPTLILVGILTLPTFAQTNLPPIDNFTLVTNLWFNGYKSNVLAMAEERIAINSNDLAGLVLKMEYDFAFMNASCISNDIFSVIARAGTITNTTVKSHYAEMKSFLESFLSYLEEDYHPTLAEIEADRAKALLIHKQMTHERYLKWLHDDGLF